MIYLDFASTTKVDPDVVEAITKSMKEDWYNPSSLYSSAESVREKVYGDDGAVSKVLKYINADENDKIIFTSGGSEANCLAIQGFINRTKRHGNCPVVITTQIEHKSINDCVKYNLEVGNCFVRRMPVDEEGFIDLDLLNSMIKDVFDHLDDGESMKPEVLVSIQWANNEIGTIQDMRSISEIVHQYDNCYLHTDAVQYFANSKVDVRDIKTDMLSVSGHKFGCPKGIGFLYVSDRVIIDPIIFGSQMEGLRGGTENVPYIVGLVTALTKLKAKLMYKFYVGYVREYMSILLEDIGCTINGTKSLPNRLYSNINVILPLDVNSESVVYALDMEGYCVSSGSACNERGNKVSHVLTAIGLSEDRARNSLRISVDESLTTDEVSKFVNKLKKCIMICTFQNKEFQSIIEEKADENI